MKTHKVFVLYPKWPQKPVYEKEATIKVCKKHTYAIINDKRYLIGSTAFYTVAAALRAKYTMMKKALANRFIIERKPELAAMLTAQIREYEKMNSGPIVQRLRTLA